MASLLSSDNRFVPTHSFLRVANEYQLDVPFACEELLKRLKAPDRRIAAIGLRRIWDPESKEAEAEWNRREEQFHVLASCLHELEEAGRELPTGKVKKAQDLREMLDGRVQRIERLPRELIHVPVPWELFEDMDTFDDALQCYWVDDPEKPLENKRLDLVDGLLEINLLRLRHGRFDTRQHSYANLMVERAKAEELIKELANLPERRGHPPGLRKPEEAKVADKVLQLKMTGDKRDVGALVWEFAPEGMKRSEEGKNYQRRITANVKKRIRPHNEHTEKGGE